MIETRGLRKVYDGHGRQVEALASVDFTVEPGQFVCVVGPSGCGKTTLLRCLAGLLAPTSGEITVGGRPVDGPPDGLAIVFQEYGRSLFPWLRVADNVELPLKAKRLRRTERRGLVDEALAAVGLSDARTAYPWQLSGGMQQRVAIARALAYNPSVLLMDEPFAALDALTRDDMQRLLAEVWRATRKTVIYVTHNVAEAVYLADRVIVMSPHPGTVKAEIKITLPRPRDPLSAEFVDMQKELLRHLGHDQGAATNGKGSA